MSDLLFNEDRECETSQDEAKQFNSLVNRGKTLLARIEEDDDILEEYEDMISECVEDLDDAISNLKTEFGYKLDERDWDFSDQELESGIYALVKLKRELAEYIEE